jgi:NadR type nicotinamide-nucleotide adenylyltransferase
MEKTIRIAITGPESTGKSAMAQALAKQLHGTLVPEYARFFLGKYGSEYTPADILWIARAQLAYENQLSKNASGILICDTDLLVCRIWSEFVYGNCPPALKRLEEQSVYDFTLLMNIDLPWVADPLREHPERRNELLELYQKALDDSGRTYHLISGIGNQRMNHALEAIQKF